MNTRKIYTQGVQKKIYAQKSRETRDSLHVRFYLFAEQGTDNPLKSENHQKSVSKTNSDFSVVK